MNIVKTGTNYRIFDDSVSVSENLPNLTFKINFNPMAGFSLTSTDELEVKEKVYGNLNTRVDKILNSFSHSERNLGVILSGTKGCGKSLTARLIAARNLYPVLLVDCAYPGVGDFISSIDQEIVVIFDEFEKHFSNNGDDNAQESLLSLFDGIDSGKKLFVITCNETHSLNEFFLNRPGRFHYLFNYHKLNDLDIKDYLVDNLNDISIISNIVKYSKYVDFTYDILRAICFDLNLGYPLDETMNELNITVGRKTYTIILTFANGQTIKFDRRYVPFSNCRDDHYFNLGNSSCFITFNTKDMVVQSDGSIIIPRADITYDRYDDDEDNLPALPELLEMRFIEPAPVGKFENFMMI